MFAVVRFLDDLEKRLVIPVTDIENFKPANVSDFDKHATYTAFWRDPIDDEGTAYYDAQVLMLAVKMGEPRSEPTATKEDVADVLRRADEEMQWLVGATLALLAGLAVAAVLLVSWVCVFHELFRDFRQSVLILWDTLLLKDPYVTEMYAKF
ncbi:hypothetical protein MTO96_033686 [Rhipicephalus appendiculatus]